VATGHNGPVHLSNTNTIFEHTQSLATKTEQICRGQEELKSSVQGLQDDTVRVENFKQLQGRVEDLAEDIDTTKISLSECDSDLRTQIQELEQKFVSQEKDMVKQLTDLNRQVEKLKSCLALSPVAQHASKNYTSTSFHSAHTGYQPSGLPSESTAENRIMHLEKNVEELQRTTALIKVHMAELELQLQASLASTHNGIFLWRIPEIRRRRRDAIEGRITSIYSPPFYSGRHGYKMCIRAYLNGDGIGYSTHLSVFFVLMRGEYDSLLKWPFENKVSLILVDQNLRRHIVQTFKPTPESSSFQQPKSDMNVASGCPQFAELSVLEEGDYVKNDVLFLKCIVDTTKIQHP